MNKILRISAIVVLVSAAWSQTTGKISGTVQGEDGTPLAGANVLVVGTASGASSDADGNFQIINVPAGSYSIRATYIGYASKEVTGARVISGLNTSVNFSLSTSTIEGDVVQVTAEKPLIQKDETSSVNVVTGDQLENMPIRDLDGVLATMPGVVVQNGDVHIRGGRDNEVAYYLNGASTTNLGNRENLVYVPQEAIEELQVQVGGYDAEVSGANSGVVKRSLKTGTESYSGSFSIQTDGSGAGESALLGDGFSYGHQTILASVSGPLGMKNLRFFGAVEQSKKEDPYVKVSKAFSFADQVDEQPSNLAYLDRFDLSWQDGVTPGSDDEFTNITGTVTYDAGPLRATLGLVNNATTNNYGGGILSQLRWGGATISTLDDTGAYTRDYVVPGRYAYEEAGSNLVTGELTFALGSNTVLRAGVSSYSEERETKDNWFGNEWKKWHDSTEVDNYLGFAAVNDSTPAWSPFKSRFSQKSSYMVNGMSFSRPGTRPASYTKSAYAKTGFSASVQHVTGPHDIKAGLDYNQHTMRTYEANPTIMKFALPEDEALGKYGHMGYGSFDAIPAYEWRTYIDGYGYDHSGNEIDDRLFYYSSVPGVADTDTTYLDGAKKPTELGFYVQDKMEFDDLVVNVGVRIDQLDPSETAPARADSLSFYTVSKYVETDSWDEVEPYTEIQPRIGVSFPFTDKTNVYGYYGRFSQLVDLNSMYFTAMDYRQQMNTGGYYYITPVGFGLEPVRTTQYEIGFKQAISNDAALKATWFYKNQKGLIQADRVEEYRGELDGAYNYVRNGDFATTKGLELSLAIRRTKGLAVDMNYTISQAEGTGSGRSSYLAALDRQSEPPLMINPLDFNQAHSGSINLDYRVNGTNTQLDGLGSNLLFTFNSGHAYTYVYRPIGGQVSAFDAGVDYMLDTRSRQALEPIGSSTTPWVYNLDFKMDKRFEFGGYGFTVFARINNLLDRRNSLNVYQATGSSSDDGFYGNDVYSESFISQYGQDPDGDGVTDYEEMYRAINIDNDESYRTQVGGRLISAPRQVFLGFSVDF
tara:strand:+ start:1407 stop:4523 length:3117 start_codon:yes stop_codon:yes gene_type:complete